MHASRRVSLGLWLLLVAPLCTSAQERIIFERTRRTAGLWSRRTIVA